MGCGSSINAWHVVKNGDGADAVRPFTPDDGDTIEDDFARAAEVDYTLGFNSRACQRFGVDDDDPTSCLSNENLPGSPNSNREETDEFRVLRVSSLSGLVTLYVAGGKHKKPVQYGNDRVCPRAAEQPLHCSKCPFCVGNERKTPPSVLMFDDAGNEQPCHREEGGWLVRAFPNIFPMLICPEMFYGQAHQEALDSIPHSVVARGVHSNMKISHESYATDPTCLQVDARGVSEVIVESKQHNALLALQEPKMIRVLLQAIKSRALHLSKQPWAKQLLIFKQYGPLSGGSLVHPHSQVVSLPVLPPQLVSRLEYSYHIFKKHHRCAVCLSCVDPFLKNMETLGEPMGDLPNRAVHVTEHFVVSVPYASSSQYSMTIAPRRHSAEFMDITGAEMEDLAQILALLSQAIYVGLDDPSYNLYVRTAPAMETVQVGMTELKKEDLQRCFHWIVEFRPRFPADLGGFEIASGVRVVTGLPEDHAHQLREWVRQRLEVGAKPIESRPKEQMRNSSRMSSRLSSDIRGLPHARTSDPRDTQSTPSPAPNFANSRSTPTGKHPSVLGVRSEPSHKHPILSPLAHSSSIGGRWSRSMDEETWTRQHTK